MKLKAAFPHMGNYNMVFNVLIRNILNMKPIVPPVNTKKTMELGSKYSPDYVCTPFKVVLGNYLEAIELGAEVLITPSACCKLGYYGEVHEQILKDLGHNIKIYNIFENNKVGPIELYKVCKKINPKLKMKTYASTMYFVIKMVEVMDEIDNYIRANVGFEVNDGEFDKLHEDFLKHLRKIDKVKHLNKLYLKYLELFTKIPLNKPKNVIKVGIVGDLYTVIEPFSNHFLEKELAKKGIEITRPINMSYLMFQDGLNDKKLLKQAKGQVKYWLGGNATDSVAKAKVFAESGMDGIIHMKAGFCAPEISAMSALNNISNKHKIPILYFSFDTETSETGIKTRLEAFYDMLSMKRRD